MRITKDYETEEEREAILAEMAALGYTLVEIQVHFDGNHLIFETGEPPHSTYISVIEAIDVAKARPVRVKRVWEGRDYFYNCFVTESVKDQYVAGNIAVGDYVIVHFDDIGEQIVTAKVFKSW